MKKKAKLQAKVVVIVIANEGRWSKEFLFSKIKRLAIDLLVR
jgi:hypothetical protein